ncbi:NAC domain-containing protein 2-like [Magnolia sinica]|uniref:NAC domain-containing protein 2-like n=1 Tax=Magnolia sinica TaxID=86752 RepID=UPI002658E8C6|nr:NAC domain-containing protein 2-like [Magnolia sinica]
MYFFTQRNRKYEGGSRPARKAGNGYWKATTGHTTVLDQDKVVGYKMNLKFHVGTAPKGKKTDWLMTEYRMEEVDPPTTTTETEARKRKRKMVAATQEDHHIRMNGFVLCRIYKHKSGAKKTNETPVNEVIEEDCTSYMAPCYEDDQVNIIDYKCMHSLSWDMIFDEITPEVDRLINIPWDNNEYLPPLTLSDFNDPSPFDVMPTI